MKEKDFMGEKASTSERLQKELPCYTTTFKHVIKCMVNSRRANIMRNSK